MTQTSRNRPRDKAPTRRRLRPSLDALENRSLLTAGALDTTFGSGGVVLTSFPPVSKLYHGTGGSAYAVQVQPDGKIVAAGNGLHDFAVARYNTDGSLDSTFGKGGKVETDFGQKNEDDANDLAIQPDGKIVVVGTTMVTAGGVTNYDIAVARYNANGTLDTSFGTGRNGLVVTKIFGNAGTGAVVIQPDGKIVVAGSTTSTTRSNALVRYNSDGTLDASFGRGGILTPTFVPGASQFLYDVALETVNVGGTPTTEIVVAGGVSSPSDNVVARFNLDGSLDPSFGSGGSVILGTVATGFRGGRLATQPDGKILEVGTSMQQGTVARFDTNGSLDSTFNPGGPTPGIVFVAGTGGGGFWHGAVQTDGKIVGAGIVSTSGGYQMLLARLNADGSPDPTFGTNGVVLDSLTGGAMARDLAIQSDGKIVTAGDANTNGDFAVARFLGDPPPAPAAARGTTTLTGSGPLSASPTVRNPVAPGSEAFDQALGTVALDRSPRRPSPVVAPGVPGLPPSRSWVRWSPQPRRPGQP